MRVFTWTALFHGSFSCFLIGNGEKLCKKRLCNDKK